jgi:phospholipase/lecithinase/hemolysin
VVKSLVRWIAFVLLSGPAVFPAQAAFSSLYGFGDGVCSSTDNPYGGASYYPYTYCNGRVWLQVLAQRQGLTYDASKNNSYMWHNSTILVTDASQFSATDASTSLFVVWVNDADFVDDMTYIYPSLDEPTWNAAISASIANHLQAIQTLYAKGARTLIMPNAVDITKIPQYSPNTSSIEKDFIRGRISYFNANFATMLSQARASLSGLTIYAPDFFTLLDNMAAHPGDYGFINVTTYATVNGYTPLDGPRATYLWWDPWDPTAKAHEVMADTVQQMIAPVKVSNLALLTGSNRLDAVNVPIGLSGYVEGRTNLVVGGWTSVTNFSSTSATQAIYVPASGPWRFYRLRFPFAWTYP